MSDRMTCPGCNTHTSSVLNAFENDRPCPHCGLSVEATAELLAVRSRLADEDLKTECAALLIRVDRLETRNRELQTMIDQIQSIVEVPHDL